MYFFPIVVKYQITVHTGNEPAADTDANVYIQLFGCHGDTGKRHLYVSQNSEQKFKAGQVGSFFVITKINYILIYS